MIDLDTIYSFKLISGEELIAKVVARSDTQIQLSKPLLVAATPQGMQLVPAMFTVHPDRKVWLNNTAISMFSETHEDIANSYIESTTGIKPITKGSILMG